MKWNRSDPAPTPEQIAAWADGELNRADAERVEAWLVDHPDAADEADPGHIVHLYRDHPPPEPSERSWQATLGRIVSHSNRPAGDFRRPGSAWRLRLFMGLAATAAVLAGMVLASAFHIERTNGPGSIEIASTPDSSLAPDGDSDEPFPVATMGEVDIISINAEDADRVMIGQQLLGTFEVAGPNDIDIVKMEPDPEEGQMPRVHIALDVPMILVLAGEPKEP